MYTRQPLILIGNASKFFDATDGYKISLSQLFKYLMVKEKGKDLQMMLMVQNEPFNFHAQGLMQYMQESQLLEIITNGGGSITFNLPESSIETSGKSTSFNGAYPVEVVNFCKNIWPTFKVDTQRMSSENQGGDISSRGSIVTLVNVRKEVESLLLQ